MEIQLGEYVRTKDGIIAKVTSKDEDNHLIIDRYYDGAKYLTNIDIKENIKKHSFNIIDLIEEGDYVNGQKAVGVSNVNGWIDTKEDVIHKDHIKSIVTKELFKLEEYIL